MVAARARLGRAWGELRRRISWASLVLPWGIFLLLFWATLNGYIAPRKKTLEVVALVILYVAVGTALLRYVFGREPFFLWLTLLCTVFTLREHHVAHSKNGVFIGAGLLTFYAWRNRARLRPFVDCRRVMSTLTAVVVSYYIAWSLDARMWRPWLPGTKKAVWSPVEESMEVVGHALLLTAAIFAVLLALRQARTAAGATSATSPVTGGSGR